MKSILFRFDYFKNSLFKKLFLSFLIIIFLLLTFNFLSFTFFRTNIHNEIIRYNDLNLQKSMESYEKHFKLIDDAITGLFFNERVMNLGRETSVDYNNIYSLMRDLSLMVNNDQLFIDNILLFQTDQSLIIDKAGISTYTEMFNQQYISEQYGLYVWDDISRQQDHLAVYPSAEFFNIDINRQLHSRGDLIPVVVKSKMLKQLYLVVLLNADQMFQSFHYSINDNFYIINPAAAPIYKSSTEFNIQNLTSFINKKGYSRIKDNFYFYSQGSETGLSYINIISNENISSEASQINVLLIAIMIISIIVCLIISIYLSFRFNTPIQQIIHSISDFNPKTSNLSLFNEFDFIKKNVEDMNQKNQDINDDLSKKNQLLTYYGYMDKLKSIINFREISDLIDTDKHFYLVMYKLNISHLLLKDFKKEHNKANYIIKELIHINILEFFPDSITIQMEKDQILSIIFISEPSQKLIPILQQIKRIFENDNPSCLQAIAVSPILRNSSQFTVAHEETLQLIEQRKLINEIQIITQIESKTRYFMLMPDSELEFTSNLQAGNEKNVIRIIENHLHQLSKNNASAYHYVNFAKEIMSKAIKSLMVLNIDFNIFIEDNSLYSQIQECNSISDFSDFFAVLIQRVIALINQNSNEKDQIVDIMMNYIHNHYRQDISLDQLSNETNLSSNYLSNYFKKQTGIKFIDYLIDLRMEKAKELLLSSNLKIQDVAIQVGYYNVNSFIRIFKKKFGKPPREFRNTKYY